MHNGQGQLVETFADHGGRIICSPELIPAPGQYLSAHTGASDSPLAVPVFYSESAPNGFRAAFPTVGHIANLTYAWTPGTMLYLRGPLGRGFGLPPAARRVALIAFDDVPVRLRGLIPPALKAGAAVTLVCERTPDDFPEEVEIQPLSSLVDIYQWADYVALDVAREKLPELRTMLDGVGHAGAKLEAQVLVRAPMPCGALAECGVCAITLKDGWGMVCKDGPVFPLGELR